MAPSTLDIGSATLSGVALDSIETLAAARKRTAAIRREAKRADRSRRAGRFIFARNPYAPTPTR